MNGLATTHRFPASPGPIRGGRCHPAHADEACPSGSEHARRIEIRMTTVAAPLALEDRLPRSIAAVGVPALVAGLRGPARIHLDHLDPSQPGLVLDEPQELSEGPRMQQATNL